MKYGILSQTRPATSPRDRGYARDLWERLDDVYRGGYQMLERAEWHLPRHVGEGDERYRERLTLIAFIGYLGEIVDFYVANLFGNKVTVTPTSTTSAASKAVYEEFFRNADLTGRAFADVLKDALTTAMVKKRGLIGIDFPLASVPVTNRADEEALGLGRPYVFEVPLEALINWEYSDVSTRLMNIGGIDPETKRPRGQVRLDVGRFEFAVLRGVSNRQGSPFDARAKKPTEEFKVWRREGEHVVWELYRVPDLKEGEKLDEETDVPMVGGGATSFREIPILELALPEPLWIGNAVGPLNQEHYRRRSALVAAQQRGLFEIPVAYLGPEIGPVGGALPSERAQDPYRGDDPRVQFERRGYMVLGKDDRLAFEGPSGSVYGIVEAQLDKLVDEMHRVSHRMAASVSNTSLALGRSGASKALDRGDTEVVLMAFGAIVRDFAVRVVDVISDARGELDVEWIAHGLDAFELEDRASLIAEAMSLPQIEAAVRSKTFSTEMRTRAAYGFLPNASPDVHATIRAEIEANASAEEHLHVPEVPPGPPAPTGDEGGENEEPEAESQRPASAPKAAAGA